MVIHAVVTDFDTTYMLPRLDIDLEITRKLVVVDMLLASVEN